MKIKFFLILITLLLVCGCSFYPFSNSKYGEMAIDAWFSDETLGDVRKNAENINEIVSKECVFLESRNNKYVFDCKITYKEKGETVIPLSKNSTINVYVVFIKKDGDLYDYKVYNSSYRDEVWKTDEYLDY